MTDEKEAKRGRDFHILAGQRVDNSSFTLNDKEIAIRDPYNIDPENFDLFMMEKYPEYKEKMFLIRNVLQQPELFEILLEEVGKKVVGEQEAIRVILLCSAGRFVENHQVASYNLLVNSESGTGKDYVVSKTLEIIPSKYYVRRTRISPTVLTYWHNAKYEPDWTWDGQVFYCEDISESVLNSDVFKVMCSNGSSATVTIKQRAVDVEVKGKPVIITTTASATPNPEMIRRMVLLQLNESVNQTTEIMKRHAELRQTGELPEYDPDLIKAQELLKRVKISIPFSNKIYPHFPNENILMRTNFPRFLDFIAASTALHQHQRKQDEKGFYIAEGRDYEIARECFLTLFNNKYMIPLTSNQRRLLSYFETNPTLKGSVTQLYNEQGIKFITDRALETNLKQLVRYGILTTQIEKDVLNRDMVVYAINKSYAHNQKLNLPTFQELDVNVAIPASTSSETSLNLNTEDTEVKEVKKATICVTCRVEEGMFTQDGEIFYCRSCAYNQTSIRNKSNKDNITSITEDKNASLD
ncbi:MAG: hypothetical protein WCK90_05840 [archaeon]